MSCTLTLHIAAPTREDNIESQSKVQRRREAWTSCRGKHGTSCDRLMIELLLSSSVESEERSAKVTYRMIHCIVEPCHRLTLGPTFHEIEAKIARYHLASAQELMMNRCSSISILDRRFLALAHALLVLIYLTFLPLSINKRFLKTS